MLTWKKTGRTVTAAGTDILYEMAGAENTGVTIESRKRHIPHANGSGTWDHTTYHVLKDGRELSTKYSLRDAKKYAEALINKTEGG